MGPCDDPVAFAQFAGVLRLARSQSLHRCVMSSCLCRERQRHAFDLRNITGKIEYNETNGVHQECLASRACRFNITGVSWLRLDVALGRLGSASECGRQVWAMQLSFLDSFRAVPDDLDCSDISDSSAYPYFSLRTRPGIGQLAVGRFPLVQRTGRSFQTAG